MTEKSQENPRLKPLSPKRAKFVDEYLIDRNATQAAIRAGYSAKTAMQQGQRLFSYVEVREAIDRGIVEQHEASKIKAHEIIDEYMRLAMIETEENDSGDFYQVKARTKMQAMEALSRHLGIYNDKTTVEAQGGGSC